MDFSQFRNREIIQIIEEAAAISADLNLKNIEPISIFVSLNQHYPDELVHYFNLCGVDSRELYSRIVRSVEHYPHAGVADRSMRMSDATVKALYITLEIESQVPDMAYPNSALVTGLLMAPGPLKDVASGMGITSRKMQQVITKPGRTVTREHIGAPVNEPSPIQIKEIIGLDDVTRQIHEFIAASQSMRHRSSSTSLECDTIIIGASGSGKNHLAEYFTHKLHEAGLISRREPVLIDAVNWGAFEEQLGHNLESVADGVLVIDNAQKLVDEQDINNIGTLDALFSAMANMEKRPIVMLLALPEGMNEFLSRNTSVARKFEYTFRLPEYKAEELADICQLRLLKKFNEQLDTACRMRLVNIFKHMLRNKPDNWASAHTATKKADSIFMAYTLSGHQQISPQDIAGEEDHEATLEEVLAKLDNFVGVDNIRDELREMVAEIECDRERYGGEPTIRSHFVFTGNPGTGKTTIARIFADVLRALKVLPSGHLVEADRSSLVSGYVGQTAIQTNELIDKAMGGVLFIDEAYTLVSDINSGSGFGKEAVDTLLKRLEDDRGKFVCIVAGYTKEMHDFLQSNPGMQSRFNKIIEFKDYTGPELAEIFRRLAEQNQFSLSEDAAANIDVYFNNIPRTRNFGNAREVRTIFEAAKKRQSRRLSELRSRGQYTPDMSFVLTREDIEGEEALRPMSIDDVIAEMDRGFVGMENVKLAVRNLAVTIAATMRRNMAGIGNSKMTGIHMMLTGNPGTGKTTVARTLGKVFKAIHLLPTDRVIEADKNAMVGQFVGSTPQKVNDIVDRAMGGILFVDEAYTLSQDAEGGGNSYGREAVETLMKRMEDDRGKFVCIVAGYRNPMEEFVRLNPGIESRITHRIHIEDYTAEELTEIFIKMASSQGMKVAPEAREKLARAIDNMVTVKTKDFGNARDVRKLLDKTLELQSIRIQALPPSASPQELSTITADDIPAESYKDIDERECLERLDTLVGLESVKREIRNLTQYLKLEKMRAEALGKKFAGVRDHYLFLGNPGTGKTTVARILGDIFLSLGISKNTRFVETDRSGLVAGYVGQTAPQTSRVIDSAMGGILFIDEAYTLSQGPHDSFGQEAIDTLLKRMEDDRGKFVCVAAGYSREMQQFLASNSGLRSRFNKIINFEDYTEAELIEIFKRKIDSEGFVLAPGAEIAMADMVRSAMGRRVSNFGNAREINTLFQRVKERQSDRLYQSMSAGHTPAATDLVTLLPTDFLHNS